MARSVEEWIGRTDDAAIPDRVRIRVFLRCSGRCAGCTRILGAGLDWQCDHKIPLINSGGHRESNLQILCVDCHKQKTGADVAVKAKAYAIQKRHLGLKKPKGRPMPGTKRSGWKRKISGEVVRR